MLNCHNRPHSQLFGRFDAFFDLDRDKHEYERSLLYPRATCCVISYADISKKSGKVQIVKVNSDGSLTEVRKD